MPIKYINSLIDELEEEKDYYKAANSKYNVSAIKKQLFQLSAIKNILEGVDMKDSISKRLNEIDKELDFYIAKNNIYKVQSLKAEKSQLLKLMAEL